MGAAGCGSRSVPVTGGFGTTANVRGQCLFRGEWLICRPWGPTLTYKASPVRFQAVLAMTLALIAIGHPIRADELPSVDKAWQLPKLPKIKLSNLDWYDPVAKEGGFEGRVLLAFDITTTGAAKNISVIWAEDKYLAKRASRLLADSRFNVPQDWATSGAALRWRIGFVYCLNPSGQSDEFEIPVEKIYINGSRIPRAPVRTKPEPGASGVCGQGAP